MGRIKIIKRRCIVCGLRREADHEEDNGFVCKVCQQVVDGKRQPEK